MKINSASEWLSQSKYGEHSMLVYSSLEEFREIYSDHCKLALEKDNELVLLIPHYETVNSVRETLKKINASKYEVEGTLVIVDTENAFQKSNDVYNILLMINLLTKRVASLGKNGLSMIADAGSFFLHEKLEELVKHELSVPPDLEMKCKASCCYHKKDFEKLGTRQKKTLLDHHNRKVILYLRAATFLCEPDLRVLPAVPQWQISLHMPRRQNANVVRIAKPYPILDFKQ